MRFGFVDQSTPERRRAACEAELAVNRELAPGVVLGVRPVVDGPAGLRVGDEGEGPAVDWVVVMRRFDERHTMASLLRDGRLPANAVERVARRIAAFHAVTPVAAPADWPAEVAGSVAAQPGRAAAAGVLSARTRSCGAARRFGAAFVQANRDELDHRAEHGRVRDGHGDLRAEHVLVEGDEVTIVDRLEFDPALRRVDVADDLAFLVMDLESLGFAQVAADIVAAYRAAGGDPGRDDLLAFFSCYRALVRAKVELLGRSQPTSRAAELLTLADWLMWRARGRVALVVTGPPASGKSTLAAALSRRSGLPVLSSDVVRKEVLGLATATAAPGSAYIAEERSAVYAQLGGQARQALLAGGVIVDATFGEAPLREAFLATVGPDEAARVRVVECRAPPAVLAARAQARHARGDSASDAGPEVAARLAAAFSPFARPIGGRLLIDTEQTPTRWWSAAQHGWTGAPRSLTRPTRPAGRRCRRSPPPPRGRSRAGAGPIVRVSGP